MEEGLQLDPLNLPLKMQLDTTTNCILKDLLEGMVKARLCLKSEHLNHSEAVGSSGACCHRGKQAPLRLADLQTGLLLWMQYLMFVRSRSAPGLWQGRGCKTCSYLLAACIACAHIRMCRQGPGDASFAPSAADPAHLSLALLDPAAQAEGGHHAAHTAAHAIPGAYAAHHCLWLPVQAQHLRQPASVGLKPFNLLLIHRRMQNV